MGNRALWPCRSRIAPRSCPAVSGRTPVTGRTGPAASSPRRTTARRCIRGSLRSIGGGRRIAGSASPGSACGPTSITPDTAAPTTCDGEGKGSAQGRTFPHPMTGGLDKPGPKYYDAVFNSPFGNDLLLEFAKRAIDAEGLGRGPAPDLLSISFSCNDAIGHTWGPDSQEVLDVTLRSDRIMRDLLSYLDEKVGPRPLPDGRHRRSRHLSVARGEPDKGNPGSAARFGGTDDEGRGVPGGEVRQVAGAGWKSWALRPVRGSTSTKRRCASNIRTRRLSPTPWPTGCGSNPASPRPTPVPRSRRRSPATKSWLGFACPSIRRAAGTCMQSRNRTICFSIRSRPARRMAHHTGMTRTFRCWCTVPESVAASALSR